MAVHQGGEVDWSRRYKANLERLNSEDRSKMAEVVRELSTLDRDHGLSAGERRMLRRARELLTQLPGRVATLPPGGLGQHVRAESSGKTPTGMVFTVTGTRLEVTVQFSYRSRLR